MNLNDSLTFFALVMGLLGWSAACYFYARFKGARDLATSRDQVIHLLEDRLLKSSVVLSGASEVLSKVPRTCPHCGKPPITGVRT